MRYAVLFRGINVGGRNIVKMADLKRVFADIGFNDVRTYIQSGNVVFETDGTPGDVALKIGAAFVNAFGFESKITLRTGDEMTAIIHGLPFSPDEIAAADAANQEVAHLYVYLSEETLCCDKIDRLTAGYVGPDQLRAGHREIYLLCHESIRDSKLAAMLGKLDMPLTVRNWKTMNKLYEMLRM